MITNKKIVIAAPTFESNIYIALHEQLKKLLKPEEMALRSVKDEADLQKVRLIQALEQTKPSALIAMSIRPDKSVVDAFTSANVPIVLIDEEVPGVSSISTDNRMGGQIAGEYLIKKGRKKIAIVSGRTKVKGGFNAEQRLICFQNALSAAGLSIPVGCTVEVIHYSREDGIEVMPKLLSMGIDAIFCAAGDNCALGLMTVIKDHGKHIPNDIAIIGFDDLRIARLSTPTLTTIRQPLEKIADAAFHMATVEREEILRKPKKLVFHPELVIRQSV